VDKVKDLIVATWNIRTLPVLWEQNTTIWNNKRIGKIRIAGKFINITVLSVHAPTNDKDEAIKDEFYDNLDTTFELIPKYDVKVITGDINAQIRVEDFMKDVARKYTIHDAGNKNGCMFG
jgi:hypothetical protein